MLILLLVADYLLVEVQWYWYFLLVFIFTALLVAGSANMRLNFFIKAKSCLPLPEKKIALTFDDGPSAEFTPVVLALLERYNATATFFCIGKKLDENRELARAILSKGHQIGNHSYTHSNYFSIFRKRRIVEEIRKTNELIHELSGKECRIFRPPYGVTNPPIAAAVNECGMEVIGWNIRSFDTSTHDYRKVVRRVISRMRPGAVILLHDDRPNTPKILEEILLYAREKGYGFAKVN